MNDCVFPFEHLELTKSSYLLIIHFQNHFHLVSHNI